MHINHATSLFVYRLCCSRFCFMAFALLAIFPNFSWAQSHPAPWVGDGGIGIRVTVAEPAGMGLSPQEELLLPLIQSTVIGVFDRFSAMTVFDRQNLENIIVEQELALSGHFSDYDFIRIGHLTNARLVVFGSITVIAGNYWVELAVTDVETGERRASYPPRQVSLLALQNLSAIRGASADLLAQLGVNLTASGLQELMREKDAARIQAENMLARGIAAQRQGTVAQALAYYFRAAAFDPALWEAVNRISVVSSDISTGNLGQDIRNRMQEYDDWRAILYAASSFYSNHLPYEFVYNTVPRNHGIDFARRTVDLSIEISLVPTDAWNTINDLREGFSIASRNEWNHIPGQTRLIVVPRQIEIVMKILNENGTILSTVSYTFSNPSETNRMNSELFFRNVNADDVTAQFIIKVASVNGIPAEKAGEAGFIQITSTDRLWEIDAEREADIRRQALEAMRARTGRNSWGVSLFFSWERGATEAGSGSFSSFGGSVFLVRSFLPYTAVGFEGKIFVGGEAYDSDRGLNLSWGFTVSPAVGLVLPIGNRARIFTNGLLEIGWFGPWAGSGFITDWMSPGFDVGVEIGPVPWGGNGSSGAINIRYKGIWLQNRYIHAITFGWGIRQ